jgi:threonine/homoserine/homoserine lactone efflux protein
VSLDPLLAAYLTFTFVLAVTPGSTTAVVVRNTLAGGRTAGFAAAAGAALGNTSQATAAGLGLAVLFARFPSAMVALRIAGAAYLAWLGISSIWKVMRGHEGTLRVLAAGDRTVSYDEHRASFRQGLTVNLLNPAISTFYLVVVPSFLPAGAPRWYYAVLASMHVAIAFTCHGMWAVAFDRLREFFRMPAARRILETATGVAMIGLAVRVLLRS